MVTILRRRLALPLVFLCAARLIQPCTGSSFQPNAIDGLTFSDVSEAAGIFEYNLSWGAAWGDYDGDGFIDVMTVGHLESICQLWHNNGDGTFSDVTTAAGMLTDDGDAHGPSWADLDNDGDLDLYVAKGTLKEKLIDLSDLWRNDGDGTFTNIADSSGVTGIGCRSRGSYPVDYDNDGDLDLFVPSFFKLDSGGPNLLYRNDGDLQFTNVAAEAGIAREGTGNWSAAWTDFDRDGLIDFFISVPKTTQGRNGGPLSETSSALYRNRGDGTFEDVTATAGIAAPSGFSNCAAWGDFDSDGDPDLYVATDSAAILYRNNDDGTFTDVTEESGAINTSRALAADWGDYDNDGYLDLYVVNASALNRLFRNNGDGTFTDRADSAGVTAKEGGSGSDASFIDYNNDGFPDLFVCNGTGPTAGPYLLFKNNGNGNHWLKIELIGQESNRDGVGARITLTAGKRTFDRQYVGQHGVAQNHIPVHFGLRGATTVGSIVIKWPSGVWQELLNIATNQTITVIEP